VKKATGDGSLGKLIGWGRKGDWLKMSQYESLSHDPKKRWAQYDLGGRAGGEISFKTQGI